MSRSGDRSIRELSEMLDRWAKELDDWDSSRPKSARLPWLNKLNTSIYLGLAANKIHLFNMRSHAVTLDTFGS
jgi:hypothetical protein